MEQLKRSASLTGLSLGAYADYKLGLTPLKIENRFAKP
jgi:hypothetical protein